MEGIFNTFFQTTDLIIDYFELTVCHWTTRPTICSSFGGIIRGTIKSEIPLHVLERDLFLHAEGEISTRQLVFHRDLVLRNADFRLNIGGYFSHRTLDVKKVSLTCQLIAHFLLVGLRWQYLLHLFNALTLRLQHVACSFEG